MPERVYHYYETCRQFWFEDKQIKEKIDEADKEAMNEHYVFIRNFFTNSKFVYFYEQSNSTKNSSKRHHTF